MLSEYDLEIRHLKGSANGRADALSRRPDYNQGSTDNENVTVLPDDVFVRATITPNETIQDEEQAQKDQRHLVQTRSESGNWRRGRETYHH